jgi:hypothetical protein
VVCDPLPQTSSVFSMPPWTMHRPHADTPPSKISHPRAPSSRMPLSRSHQRRQFSRRKKVPILLSTVAVEDTESVSVTGRGPPRMMDGQQADRPHVACFRNNSLAEGATNDGNPASRNDVNAAAPATRLASWRCQPPARQFGGGGAAPHGKLFFPLTFFFFARGRSRQAPHTLTRHAAAAAAAAAMFGLGRHETTTQPPTTTRARISTAPTRPPRILIWPQHKHGRPRPRKPLRSTNIHGALPAPSRGWSRRHAIPCITAGRHVGPGARARERGQRGGAHEAAAYMMAGRANCAAQIYRSQPP